MRRAPTDVIVTLRRRSKVCRSFDQFCRQPRTLGLPRDLSCRGAGMPSVVGPGHAGRKPGAGWSFFCGTRGLDPGPPHRCDFHLRDLATASATDWGDSWTRMAAEHGRRLGCARSTLIARMGYSRNMAARLFSAVISCICCGPLMPFVAGDHRMRYQKFLLYNAMGCIVWASVFVSLGYVAGESWRMAAQWSASSGKIVGSGLLLVVAWSGLALVAARAQWQPPVSSRGGTSARRLPARRLLPTGIPLQSSTKVNYNEPQRT